MQERAMKDYLFEALAWVGIISFVVLFVWACIPTKTDIERMRKAERKNRGSSYDPYDLSSPFSPANPSSPLYPG